jgi:DNA polymerase-3 subunit delta'
VIEGLFIADDGGVPLPWLAAPLAAALATQRGHALLVQAAPGIGALHFALALAQSWLCDAPAASGVACGRCVGCRLLRAPSHPDLFLLLPETLRRELEWPLADDKDEGKGSRQIRIAEVRTMLDWVATTASRGRGKVVVLHPAEALNEHAASALLKTVEEPPAGTRLVLTCTDPLAILPTVRSRCHRVLVPAPAAPEAQDWLAKQGLARAEVMLAAAGGRPLDALMLVREGLDAAAWEALPRQLARGAAAALPRAGVPRALDTLFKLGHDLLARTSGAVPRYFPAASLPERVDLAPLAAWSAELERIARHAAHPWNEALMLDALAARTQALLAGPARGRGRGREPAGAASLHSSHE